jgi:hypothetical protein
MKLASFEDEGDEVAGAIGLENSRRFEGRIENLEEFILKNFLSILYRKTKNGSTLKKNDGDRKKLNKKRKNKCFFVLLLSPVVGE